MSLCVYILGTNIYDPARRASSPCVFVRTLNWRRTRPRTKLEISRAFAWVLLSRDTTTCGGEGIVLIGEVGKGGVFFFLRNTQVERICIHPPNQQQWYVFENMNVLLAEVMLLGAELTCVRDLASLRSAAVTRTSL